MTPASRTIALATMCAIWAAPLGASAHAVLVASDPSADTRVDRAPNVVTLTFDEPVEISVGSLRVFDANGAVHTTGTVFHPGGDPRSIAARLRNLHRGSFVVSWQVVSADSHIVDGAYAFGFGAPAGAAPAAARDTAATGLLSVLRFLMLAGALAGIGLGIASTLLALRARPSRRAIEILAWLMLAFFAFADIMLRADITRASPAAILATRIGTLRAVTVAAAVVAVAAIVGARRQIPLLAAAVAAALSLSLAGHAAVGAWAAVGICADVVHLLAAAGWIGVLIVALTLDSGDDVRAIAPVAATAVIAIVATGIVQTVRNVGSFRLLISTTYGFAVDLKLASLALALLAAFGARRSLRRMRGNVRGFIRTELIVLAGIIAVTAVLVETPLPREAPATPSASTSFDVSGVTVHVNATQTRPQHWVVRISGSDARGDQRALDDAAVSLRDADRNTGPLHIPLTRDASGTFAGDAALPWHGSWRALVGARVGEFDENHRTLSLTENHP